MIHRMMMTSKAHGGGGDEKDTVTSTTTSGSGVEKDPYGVNYHDGDEGLGPEEQLPPRYKRDPTTGSTTAAYHTELTSKDQHLLKLTRQEKVKFYQKRLEESFGDDDTKEKKLLDSILSSDEEKSKAVRDHHPERKEWEKLRKKYFYLLREREKLAEERFYEKKQRQMTETEKEYRKFLQSHDLVDDDEEEKGEEEEEATTTDGGKPYESKKKRMLQQLQQQQLDQMEQPDKFPSNPWEGENLAWVAQDIHLYSQDELYMPPELSRIKKVNRKLATPIPKELLHHNNLDLLRRYVTPGGQIKNRIQSRLGAKDQRKIAKLVKRARAMGLIPYVGQWKIQDDGDMFDLTLDQKKDWEQVYEDAGLIGNRAYAQKRSPSKEEKDNLLRKARSLGLDVDADGNLGIVEDLKKLEKNLMMDPKTLLAQLTTKEDSRPVT